MGKLAIGAAFSCFAAGLQAGGQVSMPAQPARIAGDYGKLPLSFEANTGQADKSVRFLSRGGGYGLYLTGDEAVLALRKGDCAAAASARRPNLRRGVADCDQDVVRMRLAGASGAAAAPVGEEQLPGKANYLIGNDPAKWRTGVPTYSKVRYGNVYPGVDLVYYGNQRQLEYDFLVAPGADPKHIRIEFAGAKGLRLGEDGDLVVTAANGAITFHKPVVYQLVNGRRRAVEGSFALLAGYTAGFRLGSYDRAKPLVIDPVLAYSTYLGGTGNATGNAIAVDTAGNAYVAGGASSTDFPVTPGAFQKTNHAGAAFVTKLNPSGTALVYSTFLNGSTGGSTAYALAVDGAGNAYITGDTGGSDFPVTPGAFQTANPRGGFAPFVTKLNPAGTALVYSTYLGGKGSSGSGPYGVNSDDVPHGVALDGSGNAYVVGGAASTDFPVTPGAFQTTNNAAAAPSLNAFVTKLNPTGTALVYSTYLGGNGADGADSATGVAVDGSGNAYIAGGARSTDFPVTPGAFQTRNRAAATASSNAFITKLNPAGTALVYSTYLGGSGGDGAGGVAVDSGGNAYIAGSTSSADFPVTSGAFQTKNRSAPNTFMGNGFVTKLNPAGTALAYSTYLGGSLLDQAASVAVDGSGSAYVVGSASSTDFPVTPGAIQTTNKAAALGHYFADGFVAKLDPTGSTLVYSTFLGGSGYYYQYYVASNNTTYIEGGADGADSVALDGSGNAYVAGITQSPDFPVTAGAFQTVNRAPASNEPAPLINTPSQNGFVAKLNLGALIAVGPPSITPGGIVPVDSNVGTIQPGEWVSIYGTNLASATTVWNQDFPLSLGGTSVTIDGKYAYLWYVSAGQINLQVPDDAATGTVSVTVTTASGSATADVTMAAAAPAFLLLADGKHVAGIIVRSNGSGAYGGGTYDIIGPTGDSLGYPTVAAKAGDVVELYGTGFGPTTPAVPSGQAFSGVAPTTYTVNLFINGSIFSPPWAGLSGAGLDQINLTIPKGLGTGDVSLAASVHGVRTPSYAVISVQ
jgi:uncharacterized protein (TIGR03437 family)